MLIEKIRNATRLSHAMLEKRLSGVLSNINDTSDYILFLKAFYGYIKPLQAAIYTYIDPWLLPDLDKRRNASYIINDLHELGCYDYPALCNKLPYINSSQSAFGALYVLEGSTLGGKIISNIIGSKLNCPNALRFFSGYGAQTGLMWKQFLQCLEHPENSQKDTEVVDAAMQTFSLFDSWIQSTLCNHTKVLIDEVSS